MGNYSEAWKNEDVYFRMTKEPKEVLVKDGIPAPGRIKKGGVKVSVC